MDQQGKANFYNVLRAGKLNLTTANVFGMEKVLAYAEEHGYSLQQLKYILATAWWESAGTMHPVKEAYWMSEDWRRHHLRYFPWYGRGLIQTTWENNYHIIGDAIGVDLISNPDALLDWPAALPALFVGMERGLYTSRKVGDYVDLIDESDAEDMREMIEARRVVNGTDHNKDIAKLGLIMERALKAGGYTPA